MHMASMVSRLIRRRLGLLVPVALVGGMLLPVAAAPAAHASGVPYSVGDVFAATGDGKIKHFSSTGTLLDTLDSGTGSSEDTGMAFDPAGNLYSTQFVANTAVKFDNRGNLVGTFGGGYNAHPESIVRDSAGDFYVGEADGSRQVRKFDAAGTLLATYSPATDDRGTDWIDLAADQCTLYYTSEGDHIKRFDVCTNTQLPDFATVPTAPAYALRIRPNQEVMVAGTSAIYRFSASGALLNTYTLPGTMLLFALNLDSDLTSFWTGDLPTGNVFKVDINSGRTLTTFDTDPGTDLDGLAVFGEVTAAQAKLTLAPTSSTRQVGQTVTLTAQLGNVVNPAGTDVAFTVTGANPQTGHGTADASGTATFTYTGGSAGTDTIVASADPTLPPGSLTSNPATVTWTKIPTTLAYTGATTSDFHDPATLSAKLVDASSNPLSGKPVTFTMGAESCSDTTDASGSAACSITPADPAGAYTVTATFTEDNQYLGSGDSKPFTLTLEETALSYTGDTHIANGTPAHLAGTLTEDGVTPIAGRTVAFTLGSGATAQSCAGTTDASGSAGCTIASVSQPLNAGATVPVTAMFSGDAFYQPASATATLALQFLTGRAYGLSADVSLLLANLHLPPQPDTGEVRTATAASTTTPCTVSLSTPLISAHSLCPNVTVTLTPGTSTATSKVQDVTIGIPGLPVIKATAIQSVSTSTCTAATGSVTIANLTIGGVVVNADVGPNTGINLGGLAKLILNEQLPVPGADRGLTVNALHLQVLDGTVNVVVASATSDAHNCS